jgi:hypothetical protein
MNSQVVLPILISFFIILSPAILLGNSNDPETELIRLELSGGSTLVGTILAEDSLSIKFRTVSEMEISIKKEIVIARKFVHGKLVDGRLWKSDPNQTRLFFAPTGRALKAGQGYFSVYEIFFPFIAVGITDFLAISGGLSLLPGAESQLLYLAPKITPIQLEKFALSGGILYIKIPDESDAAGIFYGVGTYGNESAAITIGIGFAFGGGEIADKPVFTLGAELRSSNSIAFITENWLIPDSEVQVVSAGLRFFRENLAADFGLIGFPGADTEGFPFLPWIGFSYNFGAEN